MSERIQADDGWIAYVSRGGSTFHAGAASNLDLTVSAASQMAATVSSPEPIVVPALPADAVTDQVLDFAATVGAIAALGHCANSSRIAGAYVSKWGQP